MAAAVEVVVVTAVKVPDVAAIAALVEVLEVTAVVAFEVVLIIVITFETELLLLCNLGHLSQSRVNQTRSAREVNQF